MDQLTSLGTAAGLSFAAGINTYATVLIVGLAVRCGWVTNLPQGLEVLGSTPILVVAGFMYVCEFIADKILAFDSVWDAFHSFIRPVAGAGLAFASMGTAQPEFVIVMTLLGGAVAGTTHAVKAGTRLVVNTSPEPFSNIAISTVEDVGAFSLAWLAVAHPLLAGLIVAALLVAIITFGPVLLRMVRFVLGAWGSKVGTWFGGRVLADELPGDHRAALGGVEPALVLACTARRCGKAGRWRRGYLSLAGGRSAFTYNRWFRVWTEPLRLCPGSTAELREGWIADTLEVREDGGEVMAQFLVTKSRTVLAARAVRAIAPARASQGLEAA